jgi:hypothetical protein
MGQVRTAALAASLALAWGCASGGDAGPENGDSSGEDASDDLVEDTATPDEPPDLPPDSAEDPVEDSGEDAGLDIAVDTASDTAPETGGEPTPDGSGDTYVMSDPGDHCGTKCASLGLVCVGHGTVGTDCGAHVSDTLCTVDGYWIWRDGTSPRCLRLWSMDDACIDNSETSHSFCCRCV